MDRLTRKELKTDKFALEVEHGVEYVAEHRQQMFRYGAIALAVVVLAAAGYFIRGYRAGVREDTLREALKVQDAIVAVPGQPPRDGVRNFPTEDAKQKELKRTLSEVADKYPGSDQGEIARYFLGTNAADKGDIATAEKSLRGVIEKGGANYASLAKVALAPILKSQGKKDEGEKLLRSLVDSPSTFVSKESATIHLAQYIATYNPAEARKLLEPLRSDRAQVSRAALATLAELPQ